MGVNKDFGLIAYGEIYVADGSTAQTSIGTTPAKITGFAANGLSEGTTPDHTSDQITVGSDGVYHISFNCSWTGTTNAVYELHGRLNGAEQGNLGIHRKIGTGTDVGSAGFQGFLTLSASDIITVYVESGNGGGTDTFTPVDMNLTVTKVGL